MNRLIDKTLLEIRDLLADGEVSASEATRACLERIEATEDRVEALLSVRADEALALAEKLDAAGPDPARPLWGVPVVVKDVLATRGVATTCGSKILENFVPPYDATAVARLREAGAVILAKANMDEFAMGSTTENSAFKPTRNPWDAARVPGGSSGGSAATVAARQCFGSLGTDTGGSIRLPASFCGVAGIKPTYGRVSRYGLVAYGSSLDQCGPMARSVADLAPMLAAISGLDMRDTTCADEPVPDYSAALREDLSGLRIGLPEEYWGDGIDAEVSAACEAAVAGARELGAEVVPVSLEYTDYAIAAYYIIVMAESSSNLARFDGVRYGLRDKQARELIDMYTSTRTRGFGDEVQRRIIIGTYVLSSGYYDAYYRKAAQVRRLIRDDFDKAFESCDVILGPTSPSVAPRLGETEGDPLKMYLMDVFTTSVNLAGLPGLSMPVGLGAQSSMPVGLQIIGPSFGEEAVLCCGHALERALGALPPPPEAP